MRNSTSLLAAISLLAAAGCASVSVVKVPTPTQYTRWSDDMQQRADAIEGLRFYMPRPFISVYESFPVRTDIYIAEGEMSPDGNHILVKRIARLGADNSVSWVQTTAFSDQAMAVSRQLVFREGKFPSGEDIKAFIAAGGAKAQSGSESPVVGDLQNKIEELNRQLQNRSEELVKVKAEQKATAAKTGVAKQKVTNDNAAMAYQPLRGNIDIAYLPDFEEQYAIRANSGLGNVQVEVNMGQGWSLQGLDALSDNSELTKRIYSLMDTAMELAKSAAPLALGLPPGILSAARPQSGSEAPSSKPGTPVSLRFTVVHYAAKGLYPVLKPRELYARSLEDNIETRLAVDLQESNLHNVSGPPAEFYVAAKANMDGPSFTVPRYPYQYISFNTFQYMAVEAISPRAGFGSLYDKTGTTGDPGDRQKYDMAEFFKLWMGRVFENGGTRENQNKVGKSVPDVFQGDIADAVNAALSGNDALKGYTVFESTAPVVNQGKLTVELLTQPEVKPADLIALEALCKEAINNLLKNSSDTSGLTCEGVTFERKP